MRQVNIATQLGCSQAAVSKIKRRNGLNMSNCGRKRITNARNDWKLQRIVKKKCHFVNSSMTSQEWKRVWHLVSRNINFCLLQEMGYRNRLPVTKPLLNKKQQQKRLQWAREHQDCDAAQWFRVTFSDEPKFCISFGNQGTKVWRLLGEQNHQSCVKQCQIASVSDGMESQVFILSASFTPL